MKAWFKQNWIRLLLGVLCAVVLVGIGKIAWAKHVENFSMKIDEQGLEIINAYEFPNYLIEDDNCMRPYDVGDGVITFGPGITYQTEEAGINDINERFDTNYTIKKNCIDVDILHDLQLDIMATYEDYVNHVAIWHFRHFTQDQFNGLVLLSYNSPGLFSDDQFIKTITNPDSTQEQYIESADNYYKQLNSYYDNPNTDEPDDGFGLGWYNRIVDSSEVYFGLDYEYHNNAIYSN